MSTVQEARSAERIVTRLVADKTQIEFFTTIVLETSARCPQPELLGFELYRSLLLGQTAAYINRMHSFMSDELAGKLIKASWEFSEAYARKVTS